MHAGKTVAEMHARKDAFVRDVNASGEVPSLLLPSGAVVRESREERGRAEELFNETCAESERLAGETLADDAITEDAFVAVMLRRGLRDGEYEPHFERHPEQRQVRL